MLDFQPSLNSLNRRDLLRRTGGGFGALALAGTLGNAAPRADAADGLESLPVPHFAPKAKRVIFLFMSGGPSQMDTFDPKPLLAKYAGQRPPSADIRTVSKTGGLLPAEAKFYPAGESGIPVSDLLPLTAQHIDDMAIVRSMHTDFPNHAEALCMMNLGVLTPTRPAMGSWLSYGLGSENDSLPSFIVLCPGKPVVGPKLWSNAFLPARHQATHINHSDLTPAKLIPNLRNDALPPESQREQLELIRLINQEHLAARDRDDALESRIRAMELAYRMQFAALDAFDLSTETAPSRTAYGDSSFSSACLMARRLSERGVRFVQVYYGAWQPWDTHSNNAEGHRKLCLDSDRPIAALLADLKSRGLLDETLVIWGGEFGRTPVSQGGNGRDHNPFGFSMWLAGGGIKGGTVHGATDDFGFCAVHDKVHVHDLHATILHLMGLDHKRLTYRYSGRDFRLTDVSGEIVQPILA